MTDAWFFPSWNGDIRLLAEGNQTRLIAHAPTKAELAALLRFRAVCVERDWDSEGLDRVLVHAYRSTEDTQEALLKVPIKKAGPVLAKIVQPTRAVLTAILAKMKLGPEAKPYHEFKVSEGQVIYRTLTVDGTAPPLALEETVGKASAESAETEALATVPTPAAAAVEIVTVRRPTPSCPACLPGSIGPAREVLQAFLTPAEHAEWARDRAITITGGLSGHRYRLAHRHSDLAIAWGRICADLDDGGILHFHDWRVPPEEEILAAKLILEHREPWLRNEATALGIFTDVFKNQFGSGSDGVEDSNWAAGFGQGLWGSMQAKAAGYRGAGVMRW